MAVPRTWVSALAVGTLTAAAVAAAASASAKPAPIAHFTPHSAISYHPAVHLHLTSTAARNAALPGGLPVFTANQTDGAKTFKFTMVGKNPRVTQSNPSTTVQAEIIPLRIVVTGTSVSSDPTVGNSCDSTPALTRTMNSPVVKNVAWTFGGKSIGTTQYVDAFQRAEFWKFAHPTGINPNYHVKLAFTQVPVQTVNVPPADAATATSNCGTDLAIEINWLDNYFQTTLLPSLTSQHLIAPNTFPMFLVNNTVEYDTTTANCCILGYHNAYQPTSTAIQTYGISDYESSSLFASGNLRDIEIASHEIAEWMDDPLGNNATKPWGKIGQVSGCQNNLEVGDPLTGTTTTRKIGTYTYHLQELAFMSWFYHQKPSVGVNGWYSNKGTFTTPAKICS